MTKSTLPITPDMVDEVARILYKSRPWHADLQNRFSFHPVLKEALGLGQCKCFHHLVLSWPHVGVKDPKQVAYTRTEEHGINDRQTTTSVGKYVKEHFPDLKDNVIRDLVYKHQAAGCKIYWTQEWIIKAVQEGPSSCMQWDNDDIRRDGRGHHPYEVYCPSLGWGIAVRLNEEGGIVGRALVNKAEGKVFVRTYGNGGADPELQSWLVAQGYEHEGGWPEGLALKRVNDRLLPYIDGYNKHVRDDGDQWVICDEDEADFECDCTSGHGDEVNSGESCPRCGDDTDEDDMVTVGQDGDDWVCSYCCDNHYTRVNESRRHDGYYVRSDHAVEVDGSYYDEDNLPDYIVRLEDGEYCHEDNAVYCEESCEWYHEDDPDIVTLENGDRCHEGWAWQCESSGEWYADSDVDPVIVDGCKYHPDNVPEDDEEDEEDEDGIKPLLGGYDKPEGSIPNENQLSLRILEPVQDEVPHKWQHILDALAAGVPCEWSFDGRNWFNADPGERCGDGAQYRLKNKWQHLIDLQARGFWIELQNSDGVWVRGRSWLFDEPLNEYRLAPGQDVTQPEAEAA